MKLRHRAFLFIRRRAQAVAYALIAAICLFSTIGIWTNYDRAVQHSVQQFLSSTAFSATQTIFYIAKAQSVLEQLPEISSSDDRARLSRDPAMAAGVIGAGGKLEWTNEFWPYPIEQCLVRTATAAKSIISTFRKDRVISLRSCGMNAFLITKELTSPGPGNVRMGYVLLRMELLFPEQDPEHSIAIFDEKSMLLGSWPTQFDSTNALYLEWYTIQKKLQTFPVVIVKPRNPTSEGNVPSVIAVRRLAGTSLFLAIETRSTTYLKDWLSNSLPLAVAALCGIIGILSNLNLFRRQKIRYQRTLNNATQIKRAVQEESRAKSEYLAIMAHEIRTSMSGVLGMAEFMMKSKFYKEQHSGLSVIYDAGKNLVKIINQVLDFSKIDSGAIQLAEVTFDAAELVRSVCELYSKEASNKGLSLMNANQVSAPIWVRGDELRIRQILSNLVGNALKFTKEGEVTVEMRVSPVPGHEARIDLRFIVTDTGIGIPHAQQAGLFSTFFNQGSSNVEREYGGTGLGLAICRRLADLLGGRLSVESEPSRGSAFSFDVELERSRGVFAEPQPLDAEEEQHPPVDTSILLVEDNLSNQKIATMYLERCGYLVTCANDGLEAVKACEEASFDVILMDGVMPVVDGYEATRRIRIMEAALGRRPTPIIATTANTGDEQKCLDTGMNDFIPKPYRLKDLKVKIERWNAYEQG